VHADYQRRFESAMYTVNQSYLYVENSEGSIPSMQAVCDDCVIPNSGEKRWEVGYYLRKAAFRLLSMHLWCLTSTRDQLCTYRIKSASGSCIRALDAPV
jgi:hypothetical protein